MRMSPVLAWCLLGLVVLLLPGRAAAYPDGDGSSETEWGPAHAGLCDSQADACQVDSYFTAGVPAGAGLGMTAVRLHHHHRSTRFDARSTRLLPVRRAAIPIPPATRASRRVPSLFAGVTARSLPKRL